VRRKDEARPLVDVSDLGYLQRFDAVGWMTERSSGGITAVPLFPIISENVEEENQARLANPGAP